LRRSDGKKRGPDRRQRANVETVHTIISWCRLSDTDAELSRQSTGFSRRRVAGDRAAGAPGAAAGAGR